MSNKEPSWWTILAWIPGKDGTSRVLVEERRCSWMEAEERGMAMANDAERDRFNWTVMPGKAIVSCESFSGPCSSIVREIGLGTMPEGSF